MPSRKERITLGDSWVVEEEEHSENLPEEEYGQEHGQEQELPPRRSTRKPRGSSNRSPEPEFVMPPLDPDTLEASWGDVSSGSRIRKSTKGRERRSSRQREIGRSENQARTTAHQRGFSNRNSTPIQKRPASDPDPSAFQDIMDIIFHHVGVLASAAYTIFGKALRILQTPLAYMLAVGLLLSLGILIRNIITSSIYSSLSTVCLVPGSAYLLPFCAAYHSTGDRAYTAQIEFDGAMKVQSKFEEVLEATAGNIGLPLEMKHGEASVRTLRQLVKYSQLQAKDELEFEFEGFIETARIASWDLQRFNSHVGRTVDNVISITKYTSRCLDELRTESASRGLISGYLYDTVLAPFQSVKFTESRLVKQYLEHTNLVEKEIRRLIDEGTDLLGTLQNLEGRLDAIGEIGHRDSEHTKDKKREILSKLWTMLGGNRGKLSSMDSELGLLKQVAVYQDTAMGYVMGTIVRLQAMTQQLDILKEEVSTPRVADAAAPNIPLEVHIDNIKSAIERLDASRQNSRKLENEQMKYIMGKGRGQSDENLIGS